MKLFGDTLMWKSKKQGCVSTSSEEAEYVALASVCKEVMAIQGVYCRAMPESIGKPIIYEDNEAALTSAKSSEMGKLRHIDVCYHYSKWLVERKRIKIEWTSGTNQQADFLTKPLEPKPFNNCIEKLMVTEKEGEKNGKK